MVPRKPWKLPLARDKGDDKRSAMHHTIFTRHHACSQEETTERYKRWCSISSEETTNGGQDRRRHEYVFVRTSLFARWHGVETGFPSSQGDRRLCATLLADVAYWVCWEVQPRSGTNPERARGIRKWVQKVPQAVTTDVLLLGKYESPMQTTSILGEYSQGSQSFQTTRVIGTRQRRSDQWHERDGVEFVKEQNSRQTSHAQQTQAS